MSLSTPVRRLGRLLARRSGVEPAEPTPDLRPLVERINALEALVESLQDSVDRQARRHDDRLNELARQLQPSELAQTLTEDARKRGL